MNIAIIGAGAMGSLLGFYLSAQAQVWLLDGWQPHIDAINRDGLRRELDGAELVRYPRATSDPAAIGPCEVALVLVKAQQTAWAAEQARQLAGADRRARPPLVVTLQNGIGNRELLARELGEARVAQGVTSLGATLLGPGRVRHAGQGSTIFAAQPDRAAIEALAELFRGCDLPAELREDLDSLIWGKLIVNVGINALTALLRVHNGALASTPAARVLLEQAVAEAVAVAQARGTALDIVDPLAHVLEVARATGENRSSMLQDVMRSSPTEIATINGAVVREGQRLGVPTPCNALLTALVQALDATASARVRETA